MSTNLLPLSLLDLTWARLNTRGYTISPLHRHLTDRLKNPGLNGRLSHQLAVQYNIPDSRAYPAEKVTPARTISRRRSGAGGSRSLAPRTNHRAARIAAELQARVDALIQHPLAQRDDGEEAHVYTEDDLLGLYANLLAHPSLDSAAERHADGITTESEHRALVEGVAQRLFDGDPLERPTDGSFAIAHSPDSLVSRLRAMKSPSDAEELPGKLLDGSTEGEEGQQRALAHLHERVLSRLDVIVADLDRVKELTSASMEGEKTAEGEHPVRVSLLSDGEWKALVHICIAQGNLNLSEQALDTMRRSGMELPEELMNDVLEVYADNGRVTETEFFIARFVGKPTERQRHLHIKSHLKSQSPSYNVSTALTTLHNYEAVALAPPMQTYTRLITALFATRSTQYHAQAWDLFSHMRYVAHPEPDALLYALMIRACAGVGPFQSLGVCEPERALDLWTEMTVDRRLEPTVGAYNAAILTCARSKKFAGDAFRLAREMMQSHRDAYGEPLMIPDSATFGALLVAAKGTRDLARTRWILAEMLRFRRGNDDGRQAVLIDEKIMMHVFHAYASYTPPFRRSETKVVDEVPVSKAANNAGGAQQDIQADSEARKHFTVTVPQSRAEIIGEVKALFNRIMEDNDVDLGDTTSHNEPSRGAFADVSITPRLVNSYLSVHYSHASLRDAQELYDELFPRLKLTRTLRSYVEALERCAIAQGPYERDLAQVFSNSVWKEWCSFVDSVPQNTKNARLIERAYSAMIRVLTLVGKLDQAVSLVQQFVQKYPPQSVRTPDSKSAMRSSRTVLFAPKPLVRFTTTAEVPDDTVPPLLSFRNLEILHHRLLVARRIPDLGYLKYVCKAYEGALRVRRDLVMRA